MKKTISNLKVAIVYDRVNKFGGAERLLLALHKIFPNAPLYTSVYDSQKAHWANEFPKVYTSFLQNVPFVKNHHQLFGWLMPMAFEQFKFDEYDLVISVTSEAAKGIITSPKTKHLCIMLTPTRYLWSGYDFYLNNPPQVFKFIPFLKILSWPFIAYLKWWDIVASNRPDKIISISNEVKDRVKKYYNRDSVVVFPPVTLNNSISSTSSSVNDGKNKGKYFFIHGRFEPYKRLDLVIEAFKINKLPLVVSGNGSEFEKYFNKFNWLNSSNKNIKFVKNPTDSELVDLYKNAIAFLMPQEEDFGITSLEAQSFGVPVIAYKKGGSLDTVIDGKTGVLFDSQTIDSLNDAVAKFDKIKFNKRYLVTNAKRFSEARFKAELQRSLVRTDFGRWWWN